MLYFTYCFKLCKLIHSCCEQFSVFIISSGINLYDKHCIQYPLSLGSAWGWKNGELGLMLFVPHMYVNSDVLRNLRLGRIKLFAKEINTLFLDFFIDLLQEINEILICFQTKDYNYRLIDVIVFKRDFSWLDPMKC